MCVCVYVRVCGGGGEGPFKVQKIDAMSLLVQ